MKGESRLLKSKCECECERSSLEARIAGSIVNSVVFWHCSTTSIYDIVVPINTNTIDDFELFSFAFQQFHDVFSGFLDCIIPKTGLFVSNKLLYIPR